MKCEDARLRMLDEPRGRLTLDEGAELRRHVDECDACRRHEAAEQALTSALSQRMPRYPASDSFRAAMREKLAGAGGRDVEMGGARRRVAVRQRAWRIAAAAVLVIGGGVLLRMAIGPTQRAGVVAGGPLVVEVVNDHLRNLYREHPFEVESGGMHQVKPWFAGRLDFAPVLGFGGDDEFPLVGGSVGYVIDRKAATFFFKRRLHTVSLFVFRAEGLSWSAEGLVRMGRVSSRQETSRGFSVITWRDGELGYALVSDLNAKELAQLGERIAGGR